MAVPTPEELLAQQISQPAPVAPVVAPVAPEPAPLLSTVNPQAVYAAPNIQGIDIPSTKKAMDMKLSKLENKLAKAKNIADLNQIGIMNQPKAMGVLTGEASYRDKLDTARVNAFNTLYSAKLLQEQRKEEKRQQFIATYGADPRQRPKGMSSREFAAAITGGQFTNLLTTEEKARRAELARTNAATAKANIPAGADPEILATQQAWKETGGDWEKTANLLASRGFNVAAGSAADNELRRINQLAPVGGTAASPETVTAWADRITAGQAKLTDIPASQTELRNSVAVQLQNMGNSLEGKPTTTEMGKQALTTAEDLKNKLDTGQGTSAVGTSRLFGMQLIPGTAAADFKNKFQSLKDKLSLDAVKYLKGQGAVSDAERALLASAVTELNLSQSEEEFAKSLDKVINTLKGYTPPVEGAEPVGTIVNKNGKQYQKVEGGWEEL